ncbi:MAG TPA: sensor histidine kinase [Rhizomicrobium sp.]|nr:sensor histidine kinase [Rhizomicrobium sp.]
MDGILLYPSMPQPPLANDIVAEANHRIANSLTLLVGLVRMQARAISKNPQPLTSAELRLTLEGIAARIGTISQLHRLLSHVPPDGSTSLRPHLRDVTDSLVSALSSSEQMVSVVHTGGDCMVRVRHVQPIILILCEIFINAMKYAHPAGVPLIMTVDCAPGSDGRLVLTISDDGVGLPDGFDLTQSQGLGFKVMRSLAGEVGANLDIQSTGLGLTFRLSVPAAAMASAKLA